MPRAVLDENVSFEAGARLQAQGFEVVFIAKLSNRGMKDEEVFAMAAQPASLLVTRDIHFTNPLRFPPERTAGILYLTHGNLTAHEEANLIEQFLRSHSQEGIKGKLVFLSRTDVKIR